MTTCRGLGCGSRSLIFQYKLGAKQRRIALGSVTGLNFAETRKKAETLYARVKLAEDPAARTAAPSRATAFAHHYRRSFVGHRLDRHRRTTNVGWL